MWAVPLALAQETTSSKGIAARAEGSTLAREVGLTWEQATTE